MVNSKMVCGACVKRMGRMGGEMSNVDAKARQSANSRYGLGSRLEYQRKAGMAVWASGSTEPTQRAKISPPCPEIMHDLGGKTGLVECVGALALHLGPKQAAGTSTWGGGSVPHVYLHRLQGSGKSAQCG